MLTRFACLTSLVLLVAGCQDPPPVTDKSDAPTTSRPTETPREATQAPPEIVADDRQPVIDKKPDTPPPPELPATPPPRSHLTRQPKRPENSWVVWREVFDRHEDASCEPIWLGDNKFRVTTKNLQRVTVDMTQLPEGAPARGPWILYMDGQGIEMTGFKPKRGFTGHKRDLVRSKNGYWTVDKKRLYRVGG